MALPSKNELADIVLRFLSDGRLRSFQSIKSHVKGATSLTDEELKRKNRSGSQLMWIARIEAVLKDLKKRGLLVMPKNDRYGITEAGKKNLSDAAPVVEEAPTAVVSMSEMLRDIMRLTHSGGDVAVEMSGSMPSREAFDIILLQSMSDGKLYTRSDLKNAVRSKTDVTKGKLMDKNDSGSVKWENVVDWEVLHLFKKGYIERPKHAHYRITETGREFLSRVDGS